MISLEQVQLLEARVSKAIEYVQRVTADNAALTSEREGLLIKLETYQKRIDQLEALVMRFKEDQSRIEDGIIAALDRLSQFEEAVEDSLKDKPKKAPAKVREKEQPASKGIFFEIPEKDTVAGEKISEDLSSKGELDIF
ncbi:MAG: cell division protein ZapB [Treponema sp.]|jgi:predicted  nucleic acid-binding Zn-ribbon protein|nr:cell division protein ZapB [Treponema sp.]